MQKFARWLVKKDLMFVFYFIWFIMLPFYLINYVEEAADDAMYDLNTIKKMKGNKDVL